jgi:hypothetical protein
MGLADRNVAFSGYESRVYQYFIKALNLDSCAEIVELSLYSEDTAEGFRAKGVCYDDREMAAEINVKWRGDLAVAWAKGEDKTIEINLKEPIARLTK